MTSGRTGLNGGLASTRGRRRRVGFAFAFALEVDGEGEGGDVSAIKPDRWGE